MKEKIGIKILSAYSGVSEYNIRSWEKRYGLLSPERTSGGHRLYTENDINTLIAIKELIKNGHTISHLAGWSVSKLKSSVNDLPHISLSLQQEDDSWNQENNIGILLALKSFKLDLLEHEMLKARQALTTQEFILKLILPMMKQIGELFNNKEISIAQEHLISSLVRSYLYPLIGKRVKSCPKYVNEHFVILAPENEWHEIGILSVCALLNNQGIKCSYLGCNTPVASLKDLVFSLPITKVFIGISEYSLLNNTKIPKFIKGINSLPPHLEIFTGGHTKKSFQKLKLSSKLKYIEKIEDVLNF